jgi:hypothetical protein
MFGARLKFMRWFSKRVVFKSHLLIISPPPYWWEVCSTTLLFRIKFPCRPIFMSWKHRNHNRVLERLAFKWGTACAPSIKRQHQQHVLYQSYTDWVDCPRCIWYMIRRNNLFWIVIYHIMINSLFIHRNDFLGLRLFSHFAKAQYCGV